METKSNKAARAARNDLAESKRFTASKNRASSRRFSKRVANRSERRSGRAACYSALN